MTPLMATSTTATTVRWSIRTIITPTPRSATTTIRPTIAPTSTTAPLNFTFTVWLSLRHSSLLLLIVFVVGCLVTLTTIIIIVSAVMTAVSASPMTASTTVISTLALVVRMMIRFEICSLFSRFVFVTFNDCPFGVLTVGTKDGAFRVRICASVYWWYGGTTVTTVRSIRAAWR